MRIKISHHFYHFAIQFSTLLLHFIYSFIYMPFWHASMAFWQLGKWPTRRRFPCKTFEKLSCRGRQLKTRERGKKKKKKRSIILLQNIIGLDSFKSSSAQLAATLFWFHFSSFPRQNLYLILAKKRKISSFWKEKRLLYFYSYSVLFFFLGSPQKISQKCLLSTSKSETNRKSSSGFCSSPSKSPNGSKKHRPRIHKLLIFPSPLLGSDLLCSGLRFPISGPQAQWPLHVINIGIGSRRWWLWRFKEWE